MPQPPTILLLGHDGQIGWELARLLPSLGRVVGASFPQVDFRDAAGLRRLVADVRPQVIVNAAAYTAVDQAEREPDAACAVNAAGPAILAAEAARCGALLVHYSTDFVFDGAARTPYAETDTPRPLSVYGQTKLAGDQAVLAAGGPHLVLRVSWVYGLRGRNFLLTVRRLAAERGAVRIVDDQVGAPTWCRAAARGTCQALARLVGPGADLDAASVSGLYHMTCGGATSWCGFARAFLPSGVSVTPIATADYPTPARRPAYSALDCSKLRRTFGVALPDWRAALDDCLREDAAAP